MSPPRKPVILIVDDEEANVATFGRSFRKDFVVRTATSAELAIEALEREPADIVITDYTMPDMNGIELLQRIAQRWPQIWRLIVSGHADLDELQQACRVGLVAELLPKPWRRADIVETVNRLLGGGGGR